MRDKKRYIFLDVLRLGAFFLVFFYHFLVRIAENELVSRKTIQKIYEHPNFHMATLGVSLFFVISGIGLMMSSEKEWNLKAYVRKRFVRIILPFYIASAGVFAAMFLMKGGNVFEQRIPIRNLFFTIAGVDGYVKEFGISTFSLGVGEWFLGCLIIMYCMFPLLRFFMLKNPKIMIVTASVIYVMVVVADKSVLPIHMSFVAKLYEFILGMFIAQNISRIKSRSLFISAPLILLFIICPFEIPLNVGFKITVLTVAMIFLISQLEYIFDKSDKFQYVLHMFGKYSFEMYLIHHWVIIVMTKYMAAWVDHKFIIGVLFLLELIVTLLGAMLVKRIAHTVQFCYNKILKFESVR